MGSLSTFLHPDDTRQALGILPDAAWVVGTSGARAVIWPPNGTVDDLN
jgi:hypothetical protein